MIKALIFDFDGVLVESLDIKTDAFIQIFQSYPPDIVRKIKQYHWDNGGISRVEKFKYFYSSILNEKLSREKLNSLCDKFSKLVVEKVVASAFVPGAKELLEDCLGKYQMFVASGTPQNEVREIVKRRNLDKYFTEVLGSPTLKTDIVRGVLERHQLKPNEVFFIGDAINDLKAAQACQLPFIARIVGEQGDWISDSYITAREKDLTRISEIVKFF